MRELEFGKNQKRKAKEEEVYEIEDDWAYLHVADPPSQQRQRKTKKQAQQQWHRLRLTREEEAAAMSFPVFGVWYDFTIH